MRYFPSTSRTVFDQSPSPNDSGPKSGGARLSDIAPDATRGSSSSQPTTYSFTRPAMPCPTSRLPPAFLQHNRLTNITPAGAPDNDPARPLVSRPVRAG
jgi:hypothetical protein